MKKAVAVLLILAVAGFVLFRDEFPVPDDSSSTARDPGVRGVKGRSRILYRG